MWSADWDYPLSYQNQERDAGRFVQACRGKKKSKTVFVLETRRERNHFQCQGALQFFFFLLWFYLICLHSLPFICSFVNTTLIQLTFFEPMWYLQGGHRWLSRKIYICRRHSPCLQRFYSLTWPERPLALVWDDW